MASVAPFLIFFVGAGLVAVLPGGWMPYLDYQGLFGHDFWDRHRVTGGIRKEL